MKNVQTRSVVIGLAATIVLAVSPIAAAQVPDGPLLLHASFVTSPRPGRVRIT